MILVVAADDDDHASAVLGVLARQGRHAAAVDTGLYPRSMSFTQRVSRTGTALSARAGGRAIDLSQAGAVWWRRPRPFSLHDGMEPTVAAFAYSECNEAVAGLWASLDAHWVNPPIADEAAHHKPYQLKVAAEVGLPLPATLITNDPAEARAFAAERGPGRTIYKTFLATEELWRETRVLRPDEEALLDNLVYAPTIFQEYIPAVADLRVTVMGPDIFAAAITPAPGGYQVDYRMDLAGARFEPTTLDPSTEKLLLELLQRLGLVYGAIDLRRTPDGEEVFLEVNPAGEFRFVEERTGQPLTQAMASLLCDLDRT